MNFCSNLLKICLLSSFLLIVNVSGNPRSTKLLDESDEIKNTSKNISLTSLSSLDSSGDDTSNVSAKITEKYDLTRPELSDNISSNFLLLSSVNSIRFWPLNCPFHHSNDLMVNSTRHSYRTRYGISGMTTLSFNTSFNIVLWFDVPANQLYQGTIYRSPPNITNCAHMLFLQEIRPIELKIDNKYSNENFISLAIDDTNAILFMSNLIQNRIDIYGIVHQVSKNKIELNFIQTFNDTAHPTDIKVDADSNLLFWIESWNKICWIDYTSFHNLTKLCSNTFNHHQPISLTLDPLNQRVIWADKLNNILTANYNVINEENAIILHHFKSLSTVMGLVINQNWLLVHDQREVQLIDLNRKGDASEKDDIVLIESQIIFHMTLVQFKSTDSIMEEMKDQNRNLINFDLKYPYSREFSIIAFIFVLILFILTILKLYKLFFKNAAQNNRSNTTKFQRLLNNKPVQLSTPGKKPNYVKQSSCSDIEDLLVNGDGESFENPFLISCKPCRDPKSCHRQGMCLATFHQNN